MAVGTDAIEIYEGEDVSIVCTVGSGASDVTGFTFDFQVKQTASASGAALFTGTCNVTGVQQITVTGDVNLTGGSYVYGLRRTDASAETQYAQGEFTVITSVNISH